MSLALTYDEIVELTGGKLRPSAQSKELTHLGIDHKRRADGSVLVLRAALATANVTTKPAKPFTPNYDAPPP